MEKNKIVAIDTIFDLIQQEARSGHVFFSIQKDLYKWISSGFINECVDFNIISFEKKESIVILRNIIVPDYYEDFRDNGDFIFMDGDELCISVELMQEFPFFDFTPTGREPDD